jgi:ubiquinone/menaquinone biosynthesis C-methylase UbiE
MMYDVAAEFGLGADDTILDVGCGRGSHSCELVRRFGCQVMALDLVGSNLRQAQAAVTEAGLTERVTLYQGTIDTMPFEDATFSLIWCRAMLIHVPDLRQGLLECARVLKPGGAMIVYTTFATDFLETTEATRLYEPLGVVTENLSRSRVEEAFRNAGLRVLCAEPIGSEFMEYQEETDGRCSRALLRMARMIRAREQFVAELGQARYDVLLAAYHWVVYLLLGKLSPTIYTLAPSSV